MQPLQYELRCPAAKDNSFAHAAAAASNLDAAISLWSATRDLTSAKNYAHVAEHQGRTDYARNDRSRARRTQEVPFIAGCSHFTHKTQGLVLRLPPQNKAHASTFMQPLQCVLQQHVQIHSARQHFP